MAPQSYAHLWATNWLMKWIPLELSFLSFNAFELPLIPASIGKICGTVDTDRVYHPYGGGRGRATACGSCTDGGRRHTDRFWFYRPAHLHRPGRNVYLNHRLFRTTACSWGRWTSRRFRDSSAFPAVYRSRRNWRKLCSGASCCHRPNGAGCGRFGVPRSPFPGAGSCALSTTLGLLPWRIWNRWLWTDSCAPSGCGGARCRWIYTCVGRWCTRSSSPSCDCTCVVRGTCDGGTAFRTARSTGSSPAGNPSGARGCVFADCTTT